MNKQGKGKISWTDYTFNPITGCLNNCSYCYARRIYDRFKKDFIPTFHPERLGQPLKCKEPSKIFVCSVSDFWGRGVKQKWRDEVYEIIERCPHHTFQILTKQSQRIKDYKKIPENVWVGVSYTSVVDNPKVYTLRYLPINNIKFISFEPLLGSLKCSIQGMDLAIIGAMSGPGSDKFTPKKEWIEEIIINARRLNIPIFLKDNLKWHKKIQEFPKEIT